MHPERAVRVEQALIKLRHLADVECHASGQTERMNPDSWPAPPERLRAEIQAMLEALTDALTDVIPTERWRGLYFKGSASKIWHAPCDYVPELSDVDLHLWLHDETDAAQLDSTEAALSFAERTEQGYQARVPRPLHWPRPQVMILNTHLKQPNWARSAVTVLHGEAYPGEVPDPLADAEMLREMTAQALGLGESLIDKPGPYTWVALRAINWRISPAPSRLLSALGAGEWAWGQPRSVLLGELRSCGLGEVADQFEAYYRLAWLAFGSGWRDGAAMRQTVRAGLEALKAAVASLPV